MALIRAFYDQMPDGSKAVFYANHTYTYDPNYVLVHGRLDGSDLIAGIGPRGGVLGGVLRIFGLDNPLSLILMPTPLANELPPLQVLAELQQEMSALDQLDDAMATLKGNGWIFTKGGTQVNSKTLWRGSGRERLDVENPNPDQRPGQIHYQDNNGNKYIYDPKSDSFLNAPKTINSLLNNPRFRWGVYKGLKYLGYL